MTRPLLLCLLLTACTTPDMFGDWSYSRAEIAQDAQAKVDAALSCFGREDVRVRVSAEDLRGMQHSASALARGVRGGHRVVAATVCMGQRPTVLVADRGLVSAAVAAEEAWHAIQCVDGDNKTKDGYTLEREAIAMTEVCGG